MPKQTKQERIEELEAEVRKLNREINQTNEALRTGESLKKYGLDAWHAHHITQREGAPEEQKAPLVCVGGANGFSVDFFHDEEDKVIGIVVCREDKCVGMYGFVPAEYVLDEIDYQYKYGRTL